MPKDVVLVTGSSGLIGRALIERLVDRFDIVGLDRAGPPEPPRETQHVVACDVSSDDSVRAAFARVRDLGIRRLASVVHLAAYYDFSGEPSPLYEEVTVRGTARLWRALRELEVEQFVFSSTMLVHAPCEPGEQIDESSPLDPAWDYPKSKLETEKVIRREHGQTPAVLLRIAGVYDDLCHSIPIAHQIQRIYEKQLTARVFPGDVDRGQSFLHNDDLVEAIVRTIDRRRELEPLEVMLLGEPETLSYDELQRTFSRLLFGEEWETRRIPKAVARTGAWLEDAVPGVDPFIKPWMIDRADDHYALDIRKAARLLDWRPQRNLRETLPRMIAALKADPAKWYRENGLG